MTTIDPARHTTAGPSTQQFLTFMLGEEAFGMDIGTVREIIQPGQVTPLPLMPAFVRGVINLRGTVVPVIDLQARLGRRRSAAGRKSCVVVFETVQEGEPVALGLLVDGVSAVAGIPADAIEPPPAFGSGLRRDFIHGMARIDGDFIVLLDPDRALEVEDMRRLCLEAQESALA
jgi:purine-binding chemotaxis protein CheW